MGSLWDLSSCWRAWDQKHNGGMWDLSRDLSGIFLGSLLVLDPWACVPYIEVSLFALGNLSGISPPAGASGIINTMEGCGISALSPLTGPVLEIQVFFDGWGRNLPTAATYQI